MPISAIETALRHDLTVWGVFSILATLLQWGFQRDGLISPEALAAGPALAAAILVAAGLYQLTPVKRACLRRCRSPVVFLTAHWRPGLAGALRMGVAHGVFCLGCCWFLMGLLFVGGVMNPVWIGGIAFYIILLEKLAPHGERLSRGSGFLLLGLGVLMLSRTA